MANKKTVRDVLAAKVDEAVRISERELEAGRQRHDSLVRLQQKLAAGTEAGLCPIPHSDFSTRLEKACAQIDVLLNAETDREMGLM